MRVGLVSLDQRWQDRATNFTRCADFVNQAKSRGCRMVIFPEMTLTGYSLDMAAAAEQEAQSPTLVRFGELAKSTDLTILFGVCLTNQDSKQARNCLCVARPDGYTEALYAKIHPFTFAGEDSVLVAGDTLGVAKIEDCVLGATICYDLRFPEIYSALAPNCDMVVNIANWPARRVAHWRALLVARAIENQLFMLGINRIGCDGNGLVYEKSSMVVTPDGSVLAPMVVGDELDIFDIDLRQVGQYRNDFPTVRDKRYALYRDFYLDL